ncbi:MAG: hypothetical protein ACRENO_08230 [Thermodesulfobacteriota bacterium]
MKNLKKSEGNNLTTMPEGVEKKDYNEWAKYDNTEFRADENFKECWDDVDKLKNKFKNEVYLISTNSYESDPRPVYRKESDEKKRYTFAFDYAVTNIDEDSLKWIEFYVNKFRNCKVDDTRTSIGYSGRCMIYLTIASCIIEKFPYTESHFS